MGGDRPLRKTGRKQIHSFSLFPMHPRENKGGKSPDTFPPKKPRGVRRKKKGETKADAAKITEKKEKKKKPTWVPPACCLNPPPPPPGWKLRERESIVLRARPPSTPVKAEETPVKSKGGPPLSNVPSSSGRLFYFTGARLLLPPSLPPRVT